MKLRSSDKCLDALNLRASTKFTNNGQGCCHYQIPSPRKKSKFRKISCTWATLNEITRLTSAHKKLENWYKYLCALFSSSTPLADFIVHWKSICIINKRFTNKTSCFDKVFNTECHIHLYWLNVLLCFNNLADAQFTDKCLNLLTHRTLNPRTRNFYCYSSNVNTRSTRKRKHFIVLFSREWLMLPCS